MGSAADKRSVGLDLRDVHRDRGVAKGIAVEPQIAERAQRYKGFNFYDLIVDQVELQKLGQA